MPELRPKQALFVQEYLIDLNATQAAIRAGYSPKTAKAIGGENLTKPIIKVAIEKAMADRAERTGISQNRVLTELAHIGFVNLADLVRWSGHRVVLEDSTELDRDLTAAVAEVSETHHGCKIKLYNKLDALEKLGRHLGLFNVDEAQGKDPLPWSDD